MKTYNQILAIYKELPYESACVKMNTPEEQEIFWQICRENESDEESTDNYSEGYSYACGCVN